MPPKKKKYYAYFVPAGSISGTTSDWKKCEAVVKGKTDARFKSFNSRDEAEEWLAQGARYEVKRAPKLESGIYFDAGTGRGRGVEVSVTDEKRKNLLHKAISKNELNPFGKHLVGGTATNNYGELLALKYALQIARKDKVKKIFGDSKLVIEFWSLGRMKRKELPDETIALADEVSVLRDEFEKSGGRIVRISGDYNPADLGFHS